MNRSLGRRWPLLTIGASAGAATWSGWVGLGGLTGFGLVKPLPGIRDDFVLNTAITLPIGVEAYAIYALSVATGSLARGSTARRFAWRSAIGALAIGMLGQAAYHLMVASGVTSAPWWIVVLVSCMPVAVLGAAAYLWHLTSTESTESIDRVESSEQPPPVESIESIESVEPRSIELLPGDPIESGRVVPFAPRAHAVVGSIEESTDKARPEDVANLKALIETGEIDFPPKNEPARKVLKVGMPYVKAAIKKLEEDGWTPQMEGQDAIPGT